MEVRLLDKHGNNLGLIDVDSKIKSALLIDINNDRKKEIIIVYTDLS